MLPVPMPTTDTLMPLLPSCTLSVGFLIERSIVIAGVVSRPILAFKPFLTATPPTTQTPVAANAAPINSRRFSLLTVRSFLPGHGKASMRKLSILLVAGGDFNSRPWGYEAEPDHGVFRLLGERCREDFDFRLDHSVCVLRLANQLLQSIS